MAKFKQLYVCTACGATSPKWVGQCPDCHAWNTLTEEIVTATKANPRLGGYAAAAGSTVTHLAEVALTEQIRTKTHLPELDRVLGGGLVSGSVTLIGGDPGIGKSTLLLQAICKLSLGNKVLYITGEESLQQVSLRAHRLELPTEHVASLAETQVERIIEIAKQQAPKIMVVDSIQTIYTELLQSAPGSVSQVRESAALLVAFAKQTGTAIFLVGHVTKEGNLAGPRVLEHMVDCVLYFEGQNDSRYRIIRAIKNRFGAVNELGIFAMTDKGLKEISNPSAIFLSRYEQPVSGSIVMATWEGSRPMLVEIQALVNESHVGNPRRVTVGLEQNRLAMLLAVLQRHGGVATYDQDVFVNVVGGMRIMEPAADLAVALAVLSSLRNKPIPEDLIVFGEIGLAGEIRPVQSGQERLKEAAKHGFKKAIIPKANAPKGIIASLEVITVQSLNDALQNF
ncbi:MAG: repair protein RadA [Gammaproteobacteria bacterium]|jgi:DNA repair protein RadA/Sms|nr:repair protein RadA [Gammaproteobacteria bacterium]